MAKVVVKQRGVPPVTYDLEQTETLVGRGTEADILLPHNSVSRKQATITEDSRGYSIDDSGSRKGMLVNGQLVTQHRLQDGDTIEVGLFRITFQGDRPVAEARQAINIVIENDDPLSFDAFEDQATRMVRRGPDGKPILPKRPRTTMELGREGEITGGFGPPMTEGKGGIPKVRRAAPPPTMNKSAGLNKLDSKSSIGAILTNAGLGDYTVIFEENEITLDLVKELTEADLKELGIVKLGPRKRLMRAFAALNSGE